MTPCVTLVRMLAEQMQVDKLLNQVALDAAGKPWTVLVGADRRKLLPDKCSPMLLVLPEGTVEGDPPYAVHTLRVVMGLVCDAISGDSPPILAALPILDEQARPHILHLVDSIPAPVTRAGWMSEINIEAFPLVLETLEITIHERLPIGSRSYQEAPYAPVQTGHRFVVSAFALPRNGHEETRCVHSHFRGHVAGKFHRRRE